VAAILAPTMVFILATAVAHCDAKCYYFLTALNLIKSNCKISILPAKRLWIVAVLIDYDGGPKGEIRFSQRWKLKNL
jgi:hypothetical protein